MSNLPNEHKLAHLQVPVNLSQLCTSPGPKFQNSRLLQSSSPLACSFSHEVTAHSLSPVQQFSCSERVKTHLLSHPSVGKIKNKNKKNADESKAWRIHPHGALRRLREIICMPRREPFIIAIHQLVVRHFLFLFMPN